MANDKKFVIKNGLSVGTRYLQTGGTETAGSTPYSLSGADYDSKSFSVSGQVTAGRAVELSADGTKMYVLGVINDTIYQYTLSTAWDVSTASYDSVSLSLSSQTSNSVSFTIGDSGSSLYVTSFDTGMIIYQYALSTAYDLSTASYASKSYNTSSQITNIWGTFFKADGLAMYVMDYEFDVLYQYTISTAWDVSTASYASKSLDVSSQDSQAASVYLNPTGTFLFVVGVTNDSIYKYSLSTAWDISSATLSESFVTTEGTFPAGLYLKIDGTKMYVADSSANTIYQYSTVGYTQTLDLSTGTYFSFTPSGATTVSFTNAPASGKAVGFAVEINGDGSAITWPSSVKWPSGVAPTATASKEVYSFVTTDGGTSYYGKRAGSDIA